MNRLDNVSRSGREFVSTGLDVRDCKSSDERTSLQKITGTNTRAALLAEREAILRELGELQSDATPFAFA